MRKVIDTATRMYHWLFAFSFVGAYISADSEKFRVVHIALGYTMIGLLAFRILWGFFGPRHMRLSAMFRKLQGIRTIVDAFRDGQSIQSMQLKQSANLMMTVFVMALLFFVIPLTVSGYMVFNEIAGHWMEEVHEFLGELMLTLVIAHITMILIVSMIRRSNLANSMITGYVAGVGPDLIKQDYKWISVLMVCSVTAWIFWYVVFQ